MKPSTRSALLLFSTLLIGMAIGSLVTGALNNRRLERLVEMRSARGLSFFVEEVVRPESPEQLEAIRAVLEEAGPRFAAEMRGSRERMRQLADSVRAVLDPLLTPEQRARLDDRMRITRGRMPFGPPGAHGPEDGRPGHRPDAERRRGSGPQGGGG
jgi:hypothetical protein